MMDPSSPFKCYELNNFNQQNAILKSPATTKLSPNFPSPIQDGRESLGILPPDFEKDLNFLSTTDPPSFRSVLYLEDSDVGRESLGILQLNNLDVNFGNELEKVPDIMLSFVENVDNSSKILDTGFILSSPSRALVSTSQNSLLSFNSNSLEFPSKIFTLTKNEFGSSLFSPSRSFLNNAKLISSSEVDSRNRVNSQPLFSTNNQTDVQKFFWSTGRPTQKKRLSSSFSCGKLDFDEKDDMFHDSVFIEGNHIAQKIADGSFLTDHCEVGPLDSTPQPEWPQELDESEVKNKEVQEVRFETETVFKTVDKLLPSAMQTNEDLSTKTSRSSSTSSSKSRDAKEILQNLSEIFNTTHKSDKQKSQGRLLLNSLAEMLNNSQGNKDNALEDSGHSSITENDLEKDKPDAGEMDDLNKKDSEILSKINTSVTSEACEIGTTKRLSQSFCPLKKLPQKLERRNSSASPAPVDASDHKTRNNSNASVKSNDSTGSNFGTKIKPKLGNSAAKKGPLRAVIPLKEMKKGNSTPGKNGQTNMRMQSKRTSTPINEPQMKPMAASTPTLDIHRKEKSTDSPKSNARSSAIIRSNSMNERNLNYKDPNGTPSTSKLRRPSTSAKEIINTSSSIPSRLQAPNTLSRRNSISEGVNYQLRTKRSNSLGKETGIMSSLRKVRENILKSPYYDRKTGILIDSNAKAGSDTEKKVTFRKSLNSSVKLKKTDKENVC